METPRDIEGAMPPLQIDWVPINADQSVAEAVVVQPKLVAARFFGMPEEVVPLLAGNQEWPRTTKANQFFKLIQELMVKLVNERLHGIEGQVNGVLELVQAREEMLARAQNEMQQQVQIMNNQVLALAERSTAEEQMDWQPSSTVIIPDFSKIIEEKIAKRLYRLKNKRDVPPALPHHRRKRESLLDGGLFGRTNRRSKSPSYRPDSPSAQSPSDSYALSGNVEGTPTPWGLGSRGEGLLGSRHSSPRPDDQEQWAEAAAQQLHPEGTSRPSRHGQAGLGEGSSSRRTPRIPTIQEPEGSRSHSAPVGPSRGNVPPPPNPPAAGGAPNPGDSSSDDDDEGPDPRRDPRGFRKWAKEKASAGVFIKMVKTIMGRDKKKNEESRSMGKSPDPQPFDGDSGQLERFLRQLSNKFALERRHYKLDLDKIRYASLLLKGTAAKWYEAYHLQIDSSAADHIRGYHQALDPSFATWDRFVASLRASFGSRLTREKAVREFQQLQHTKGIDAYLDELIRLMWQTGYSDDVVKDKIDASLNNELSKDWSKVDKPTELAGWLMKLREMGHRNERWLELHGQGKKDSSGSKGEKKKEEKKGDHNRSNKGKKEGGNPSGKKKKEGGWKDKAEELKGIPKATIDERAKGGKCLKCGKDNHNWYDCWHKEPVIGKVTAGNKRKGREEPEGKEEKRPQKKSKAAASTEVKKEEKKVSALATSAGRIIELNSDTEMDEDLDVWAVEE
jgi:hypothetical protein